MSGSTIRRTDGWVKRRDPMLPLSSTRLSPLRRRSGQYGLAPWISPLPFLRLSRYVKVKYLCSRITAISFLSKPADWVRQSIPFSYLSFEAASNDGEAHHVQVYSDVSAGELVKSQKNGRGALTTRYHGIEWLSGDRSALVDWSTTTTDSSVYHEIQLQTPMPMTEVKSQASDGTLYYSMSSVRISPSES